MEPFLPSQGNNVQNFTGQKMKCPKYKNAQRIKQPRRIQQTRCDASQFIYFCKTLYMFQTVLPSIIRSSKLHIQRQVLVTICTVPPCLKIEISAFCSHGVFICVLFGSQNKQPLLPCIVGRVA